jgi:methylated-DNA-[protein]-cysteine S-methyltransferase
MITSTTSPVEAELAVARIDSPVGTLSLVASSRGLRAVLWPLDVGTEQASRVRLGGLIRRSTPVLDEAERQLHEYFEGARLAFELPLDLQGTSFQRTVWLSLADVGFGKTRTYGEQAERLGRPTAVRAVAAANGRNPLSIVLPCHRIVGANGSLTGYAGGLDNKARLLDHERRVLGLEPRWSENRLF